MSIPVGKLVSELRTKSRIVNADLGDVEVIAEGDMAGTIRVGDTYLPWGDRNTQFFINSIGGPGYKYVQRSPLDWQREIVQHHTTANPHMPSVWHIEGNNISGIYHPDDKVIPLVSVAERINNIFAFDDEVDIYYAPDQIEMNVTSYNKTITVPGIPGVESRPMDGTLDLRGIKVGDLSAGGVRIIMCPGKPERAPIVEEFWKRYVCTNGQTRRITGSQVNLRGRTVDEVLNEIEKVARAVFEGLEGSGRAILHSAETPVLGAVADFIRVVAKEHKINAATTLRLQELGATLHPDPSVYDVSQFFTGAANDEGMPVSTRRALQAAGGALTVNADREAHRCEKCAHPLDGRPVLASV